MKAWMYILRCIDNSYYVGSTKDLKRRIQEHKNGGYCKYTSQRLPVELIYSEAFLSLKYAKKRELQIKGWTREKKEALMEGNAKFLHGLARCKNETSHFNCPSTPLRTVKGKKKI